MPKKGNYNGHKSWAYWNVALWIGNDEGLYNLARDHIRRSRTKDLAAQRIHADLLELGHTATPDGANYSISAIREAIRGL